MITKDTLNGIKKNSSRKFSSEDFLILSLLLLVLSPFFSFSTIKNMTQDTIIQIKLGLDSIANGKFILEEIYSWHEGLNFVAHESLWYLLLGGVYKLLGLWGIILVGAVFTYGTGYLIFSYLRGKANPLIIGLSLVLMYMLGGFPDYNIRPSVTSIFFITLVVTSYLSNKSIKAQSIIFVVSAILISQLHGGILPLLFVIEAVLLVIDLLIKEYKPALFKLITMSIAFLCSLINPIGINIWLFGIKQSGASEVWNMVDEWLPRAWTIHEAFIILLVILGFMLDEDVRKFKKEKITKIALLFMFIIMSCVYKRFALQLSVIFILSAPEELTVLLTFLKERYITKKRNVSFSRNFYYLISIIVILATIGLGAYYGGTFIKTNTIRDVEDMAAYDSELILFLKEKNYRRIYNSFTVGSYFAFYDIPVHIDNRLDPYLSEFSGEDHLREEATFENLKSLDDFVEKYDVDAIVLESMSCDMNLVSDIMTYASDRYEIVYAKETKSTIDDNVVIWIVIEPRIS